MFLLGGVLQFRNQEVRSPFKQLTWIEIDHALKHPPEVTKDQKEKRKNDRRKIVQTSPAEKTDLPKPDSFLSWQNQIVDRETVSKGRNISIGHDLEKSSDKHETSQHSSPQLQAQKSVVKDLSQLGVHLFAQKTNPDQTSEQAKDEPQWTTPGSTSNDYVQGIREGDRTALNTREYAFYNYFQRIRERLDHAWVPILKRKVAKYLRSGRRLASDMDLATRMIVTLSDSGDIIRVQVTSESGVQDLDDAAVRAFNEAGPFPNPPKGIVDINREIKIPWNFVLKT